jgi:xylulokinase
MEYVIAYDLGTSGVKAVLVDTDGTVSGAAMETYPLHTPQESYAEQEPEDYWHAVCLATKRVLSETNTDPAQILGIAFCSQWKAIIPLDADGKLLHRGIIWLDARADEEAKQLNKFLQVSYFKENLLGFKPSSKLNAALGRNILCGADYWPKLMWYRAKMPELYAQTDVILECNSYVKWRATGEKAVDMTNHFTRSFSPSTQGLYNLILKLAKVDPEKFPPIVMPSDRVGGVTQSASAELGLPEGLPVFGGCSDIPAISIGSGCGELGDTHVYLGSSGWLASMVQCKEGFLSTSPFNKENDLLMFGFQAIGLAFDWAARNLYRSEYESLGSGVYELIEKECAAIAPGSDGLLANHWMYGERPPFFSDKARGAFANLTPAHTRAHMINAVMESVCYSMKMSLDALENGTRREIPAIHAVGGCAVNDSWMQTMADVLNIPVRVPAAPRHAGAVGTAYCVLIGLGRCKDFDEAKARIKMGKTFNPRKEATKAHEKNIAAYKKLHKSLSDIFSLLR